MSGATSKNDKKHIFSLSLIILLSFVYAVLRYHVFKGVVWVHFPLYVTNKAISLAAISISCLACLNLTSGKNKPFFVMGLSGYFLACLHVLISLVILNPSYYAKFFQEDKLNLNGELNLLFGIIGFVAYSLLALSYLVNLNNGRNKTAKTQLSISALILVAGHTFVMGFTGWLKFQLWPGYLPPISLLSFLIILLTLTVLKYRNLKN